MRQLFPMDYSRPHIDGSGVKAPSYISQRNKVLIIGICITLFLLSLIFAAMKFFSPNSSVSDTVTITPSPTTDPFPQDTPVPSPTPETISTFPTVTIRPTVGPIDKETKLDRRELSVEVQNGSGEVGAASKGSDVLKSFGYKVSAIGNADAFSYEGVVIKVRPEKKSYGVLLKKDLSTVYSDVQIPLDLEASVSADAIVIIGK